MISQELKDRIDYLIMELAEENEIEKETYDSLLGAFDGCDGLSPQQLCTYIRAYMPSQQEYLCNFAKDNPPTIDGRDPNDWPKAEGWLRSPHCFTDDQGFEGSFTKRSDGIVRFERFFEDDMLDDFEMSMRWN